MCLDPELRVLLLCLNPFSDIYNSKAFVLLWIFFVMLSMFIFILVICLLSCLFLAAFWSSSVKELTSSLSCVLCFIEFWSLSHMVFWVGDGT